MWKYIKAVSLFLSLIFLFSGCKYQIDENKTKMFNSIEEIEAIKELENSAELKSEFLKLFEEYSGFSLPKYFVLPKTSSKSWMDVDDFKFFVFTYIIMEKNDALEILNKIKNNNEWIGYRYWSDAWFDKTKNIEKNKEKCSYFVKTYNPISSFPLEYIYLNFHYNKDYDNYIVWMQTSLYKTGRSEDGSVITP